MKVRRATTADAFAVAEVFSSSLESLSFLPRLHTHDEHHAFIAGLIERNEVWMAEDGSSVVGLAALTKNMLTQLYVHPAAQGQGVGSRLLSHVKERSPGGFTLWVFQQNERARCFYERHGCRLVRLTGGHGNEERMPDALYEWRPGVWHVPPAELHTERLVLRQWRDDDIEPFARLNADPDVRRYYPTIPTRAESERRLRAKHAEMESRGWGRWAVELAAEKRLIGYTGLSDVTFTAAFTPAVEVGWGLSRDAWGHGFATEAGRAALGYAFDTLQLDEVVSFTAVANGRSRRVMERLGMGRVPTEDFDHPNVPEGPLRRHVLYRVARLPEGFPWRRPHPA